MVSWMWSRSSGRITSGEVVTLIVAAVSAAACDPARDRPTGLTAPLPPTTVSVVAPQSQQAVPADSITVVQVKAEGLLQAVELVVTKNAQPDTVAFERRDFASPQESVDLFFDIRVPSENGTQLEFRAIAEDVAGGRHSSVPVFVVVIDCDVFPVACTDL